jgi:hypothetical protein
MPAQAAGWHLSSFSIARTDDGSTRHWVFWHANRGEADPRLTAGGACGDVQTLWCIASILAVSRSGLPGHVPAR